MSNIENIKAGQKYQIRSNVIWEVLSVSKEEDVIQVVPFNEVGEQIGPDSWRYSKDPIFNNRIE